MQHRFCKIAAIVLNSSIVLLMNNITKLNIRTSKPQLRKAENR
jgi:hypothetical protein